MRKITKNKKGLAELFILMVIVFTFIMVFVIMLYASRTTLTHLHDTLDDLGDGGMFGTTNVSATIDQTFGEVPESYNNFSWIIVMLIFAMVMSIFYGSYKVRTQPIYFVPYFFIVGIAIVVAVVIANAYEQIIADPTLASTFAEFTGGNYFILNLPVFVGIVGMVGAIIMFISWVTRPEDGGFNYYGY